MNSTETPTSKRDYKKESGDWGHLPLEPCRFCHVQGKVYFRIDDGPEGRIGLDSVRCDNCGRTWTVDSANA